MCACILCGVFLQYLIHFVPTLQSVLEFLLHTIADYYMLWLYITSAQCNDQCTLGVDWLSTVSFAIGGWRGPDAVFRTRWAVQRDSVSGNGGTPSQDRSGNTNISHTGGCFWIHRQYVNQLKKWRHCGFFLHWHALKSSATHTHTHTHTTTLPVKLRRHPVNKINPVRAHSHREKTDNCTHTHTHTHTNTHRHVHTDWDSGLNQCRWPFD